MNACWSRSRRTQSCDKCEPQAAMGPGVACALWGSRASDDCRPIARGSRAVLQPPSLQVRGCGIESCDRDVSVLCRRVSGACGGTRDHCVACAARESSLSQADQAFRPGRSCVIEILPGVLGNAADVPGPLGSQLPALISEREPSFIARFAG